MATVEEPGVCKDAGTGCQGRQNGEGNHSQEEIGNTFRAELKDVSCQVELGETSAVYQAIKEEFELEKAKLQNNFIRERTQGEMNLREECHGILKEKNALIQVLTHEKDFLWEELKNLRASYDLLARRSENSREEQGHLSNARGSCHENCRLGDDVRAALRHQKGEFVRMLEEERMERFRRCEREKVMLTELVSKECDEKYARERTYLLESIDGLKEGLTSLTEQKDELARIFEGEKNAMELGFARKEKELKEQLELQVQKRLVQAHASWSKTQV